MKSSVSMYKIIHDYAVVCPPVRHEGKLGYAIRMNDVNRLFFEHKFSSVRQTKDRYISEWCSFGIARLDSTGEVLWIIDPALKKYLVAEKKGHEDCRDLEVLA